MSENIYYIVSMVVSGGIFMGLSLKYSWDINIWKKINSKIGQAWNVVVWLTAFVVLQIILQVILEIFSFDATIMKIILGGVCGIYLATMPRLERKSKQVKR